MALPITKAEYVLGLRRILDTLDVLPSKVLGAAQEGLLEAGAALLAKSQQYVPVEFGELKASGFIGLRGKGRDMSVIVGYSAPYAAAVHELVGMKLRGQPRPSGMGDYWDPRGWGQAKFLEQPARMFRPQMVEIVKKSILDSL